MSANDEVTQWQHLATEAKGGRLQLDPSVAGECLAACEDLLRGFEEVEKLGANAQRAEGFGGFDSGQELSVMFAQKGIGGPDAIDLIIQQHKEVVALIRETISASVNKVTAQDESNSQGFSAIQPG